MNCVIIFVILACWFMYECSIIANNFSINFSTKESNSYMQIWKNIIFIFRWSNPLTPRLTRWDEYYKVLFNKYGYDKGFRDKFRHVFTFPVVFFTSQIAMISFRLSPQGKMMIGLYLITLTQIKRRNIIQRFENRWKRNIKVNTSIKLQSKWVTVVRFEYSLWPFTDHHKILNCQTKK